MSFARIAKSAIPSRSFQTMAAAQSPKINRISPLSADEAKWTELRKIETGKGRVWEAAARKTTSKGGVDAVAIAPILRHPNRPVSTMIILQYRPPVNAVCVEFPAGLIDEGETPEQAAVRELKEETGYEGKVCEVSPSLSAQPGMTNAKLQMVHIEVELKEGDKEPEQHLDEGEHIERIVVPISELYDKLQEFVKQGYVPDLYVAFVAYGWHWGRKLLT
nr:putative nudix hydrolase p35g2.12 [Quercus suber]